MNGVIRASVSAGSSQRETRVTCTPMAMVPSGGTASAGDRPAQIRAKVKAAARSREPRISIPPLETFGNAVFVLEKLPHLWRGEAQGDVHRGRRGLPRRPRGERDWGGRLCSAAAPPRRSTQRGESGAEEKEAVRRWHVRPVRSDLEIVYLEHAEGLKCPILDAVRAVGGSRRQNDGSGIRRKPHIDDRTVGSVDHQQSVAERSANHIFKQVTVENGARRVRGQRGQREVEEFAGTVREDRRSKSISRKQSDAGGIREVIDAHLDDGACP